MGGGGGAQRAGVNLRSYDHKFGMICFSFQCCFASKETIRRKGTLGTGNPGRPPVLSHSS